MAKIRQDETGLYIISGGYLIRPKGIIWVKQHLKIEYLAESQYKIGDYVRTSAHAGPNVYLRQGKKNTKEYHSEAWTRIELSPEMKKALGK
ncbi:hypothetical protein LCGC14_0195730 [marine sediment metagenome]|uniref:Uncharacterized protein n=1 Tax=marine sediment metagenome TaxID=412755 RepID=A0A0F9UKF5_9ZZZZ